MDPHERANRPRTRLAMGRPAGFSLAEMMIALAILGFGLLVIGAALPIGLRYTRESVERAAGVDATSYMLDELERSVRLARDAYHDSLIRPRDGTNATLPLAVDPNDPNRQYEPVIKVRPVYTTNINYNAVIPAAPNALSEIGLPNNFLTGARVETAIAAWYTAVRRLPVLVPGAEFVSTSGGLGAQPAWCLPALSAMSSIYPPVTPADPLVPALTQAAMYGRRTMGVAELKRASESRVVLTSFYRRVSYAPGSDPSLYEVITVASSLQPNARFPAQNPTMQNIPAGGLPTHGNSPYDGWDSYLPIPWLITFQELTPPPAFDTTDPSRPITGPEPSRLIFKLAPNFGGLLPTGSLIIPAVNDFAPSATGGIQTVGFVPNVQDAIPIYEVIERPDPQTVVVSNKSRIYPCTDPTGFGIFPERFPCWIIPPAYDSLNFGGDPLYQNHSSILGHARRIVSLRETQ